MTTKPDFECVAQLGDAHPLEYGGYWVLRNLNGGTHEAEYLEVDENMSDRVVAYRVLLEQCTFINGILSDNEFHPEIAAWFAKPESERLRRPQDTTYLLNVADYTDCEESELIEHFCSNNPLQLAEAYRLIGEYHGWLNLDQYPIDMTFMEAKARYSKPLYQVVSEAK